MPRYVSASPAITGNRLAAIRNVSFFENDAVPRMAVLVSGGKLTAESVQSIEDFMRTKNRGPAEAHRVMVIQVEPQRVGFQQTTKTKVDLQPLTVGVTEDASFQTYRQANDDEIREVFGIAPVFFVSEGVNRATAAVSRQITNEQEFEPDRLAKEFMLNQTIMDDLIEGDRRIQFRFERLQLTDPLDKARMDQMYASLGAVTPNELREGIGKPKFPKTYLFADKPLQIVTQEISRGLAVPIAGEKMPEDKQMEQQAAAEQGQAQAGTDELAEAEALLGGGGGGAEEMAMTEQSLDEMGSEESRRMFNGVDVDATRMDGVFKPPKVRRNPTSNSTTSATTTEEGSSKSNVMFVRYNQGGGNGVR